MSRTQKDLEVWPCRLLHSRASHFHWQAKFDVSTAIYCIYQGIFEWLYLSHFFKSDPDV